MNIRQMRNTDADFYTVMGPYLARRSIIKALGEPLYDDDDKVWFVAVSDGQVQGFAAITPGTVAYFDAAYVMPEARNTGVYRQLLSARLDYARQAGSEIVRCTATRDSEPILHAHGFQTVKEWKYYVRMELVLKEVS